MIENIGNISSNATTNSTTIDLTSLSLQNNDVVFVSIYYAVAGLTPGSFSVTTSGYTIDATLSSNGANDAEILVAHKKMSSTPDSSLIINSSSYTDYFYIVQVFRGVNEYSSVYKVTTASGVNPGIVDPSSITPLLKNSLILISGVGTSHNAPSGAPTVSSGYSNVTTGIKSGSQGGTSAMASKILNTPALEDPGVWSNMSTNKYDSWVSVTLVLNPIISVVSNNISHVSNSSGNSSQNYAESVTSNKPTGVVDGDIMLAELKTAGQYRRQTSSGPAGWILLGQISSGTKDNSELWYKIASSEGSSYTWSMGASQFIMDVVISAYRGVDTNQPIIAFSNLSYLTYDTIFRAGSVSVPASKTTLVFLGWTDYTITVTKPTNPVNDWNIIYNTNNYWYRQYVYSLNSFTGGTTGNVDATLGSAGSNKTAFLVSLLPFQKPDTSKMLLMW